AAYRIRVVSRPRDSAVLGSSFPQFNVNGGCGARAAAAPLQRAVARSPPGSRARQADSASQEELKMRAEKQVPQCQPASENLVQLLQRRAKDSAKVAATHKRGDGWADVTWGAILEEVKKVSAGLTAWGIRPGDRIALFAATNLQWIICDLAIAAARAITVPIYSSNTPDEVRYILNNSEAVLLFVGNDEADA